MLYRRALRQPHPEPQPVSLWWTNQDIPPLVMQSTGGPLIEGRAFATFGLATEAARLHITALAFVHFFSGYGPP